MASRRFRSRKTLSKSVDQINKRLRYVEKRTGKTRLNPRVVTTEKLYAKTVTTPKIAENAVTTETIAPGAVTTAEIDFSAGDIGGSTSYVQPGPPSNPNLGDIWFDSDASNELKQWNGTAWVSVRDATIAVAQAAANAAQTTADGKNKIYRQGTTPTGTFAVGDLWFDTANDNRITRWDGSTWVAYGLGNAAIANLDAGKITTGYLAAGRIQANTIEATMINAGAITSAKIAGDAIDGKTITGATVRTSSSTTRAEMNSSGIFVYSGGSEVVALRSNGTASFSGSVSASSFSAPGLVDGGSGGDLASSTITDYNISSLNADKVTAGTFTGVNYQSDAVVSGGDFNGNRSMLITAENATPGLYMYDDINDKVELSAFYGLLMQYGDTKVSTNINLLATGNRVQIDTSNSTYAVEVGGSINVTSQLRSGGNLVVGGNGTITGNLTVSGTLTATVATATNATQLGGVAASGYLRSNASDSFTGTLLTVSALSIGNTIALGGGFGVTTSWSPNVSGSGSVGISSRVWASVYATDTTINTSDARTKKDIEDSPLGLDFINALRPRVFKKIVSHNIPTVDADGNPVLDENGEQAYVSVPGTRPHYGFISQEIRETYPQFVEDFGGWVIEDPNKPDSGQFLRYTEFISPMVKAIQELSTQVSSLQARIATLEG